MMTVFNYGGLKEVSERIIGKNDLEVIVKRSFPGLGVQT